MNSTADPNTTPIDTDGCDELEATKLRVATTVWAQHSVDDGWSLWSSRKFMEM